MTLRVNWMAPSRFAYGASNVRPGIASLYRDLGFAMIPVSASADSLAPIGREVIGPTSANSNSGTEALVSEACGPAIKFPQWARFDTPRTLTTNPFSAFAFIVPRASGAQVVVNYGDGAGGGATGWGLQSDDGAGKLGMVLWAVAAYSSTLASPSLNVPACIGCSYNGSSVRFFVNGRFDSVNTSTPVNYTGKIVILSGRAGHDALFTGSMHTAYIWKRAITDAEMLTLYRDPWAIVRSRDVWMQAGTAGGGSSARIFVPAFIG